MLATAPDRASSPLPPVAEATRAATIGLAAAALGFAAAYVALPAQRSWFSAENGLVDLATAVLLALVALAGVWAIRRTPGVARWSRLLPAAALLGLMDEVHFGASLFGFQMPRVGPVTVDGLSALLAAGQHLAETQLGLGPLDLAAGAALVAAVGAFVLARRRRAARATSWLADHPPALHLLASAALVILALAIDLFFEAGALRFTEEWLEFGAAAALLRGALLIPRHNPQVLGWRQRLRPWLESESPRRAVPAAVRRPPRS